MTEDRQVAPPTRARVYRVSVAGDLGPALQAALADLHPTPRRPSTLLRLQLPAGRTIRDVAAQLEECGLELLTLRVVPDSEQ